MVPAISTEGWNQWPPVTPVVNHLHLPDSPSHRPSGPCNSTQAPSLKQITAASPTRTAERHD